MAAAILMAMLAPQDVLAQSAGRSRATPSVTIFEFGNPETGGAPALRRARSIGDIRDWIRATDPEVVLLRAELGIEGSSSISFDIDPAGKVSGCRLTQRRGDPRLTAALCARLTPRVRMTPALDANGQRVPDVANFVVGYTPDSRPRLVSIGFPYMTLSAPRWPPTEWRGRGGVTGLDLLSGGAGNPAANSAPWAGITMTKNPDGELICDTVTSSGSSAFDYQACQAARQGQYELTGSEQPDQHSVELLYVRDGGRAVALPASQQPIPPVATPESLAAVRSALTGAGHALGKLQLLIIVSATGSPLTCSVSETSGSDAADIAACPLAMTVGRFAPAQDIFGRIHQRYLNLTLGEASTN